MILLIAFVKGTIAYIHDNFAVIDVNGIGYQVNISPLTLSRLPALGSQVQLFTYHQISENGQSLHGFLTQEELRMFSLLISVSGVGPKVATGVLGVLSPSQIMMAIVADDAVALSKAPGIGKKTAGRLLLELKDKIKTEDSWEDSSINISSSSTLGDSGKRDAMDALIALGYGKSEAMQAVLEVNEDGMDAGAIIKLALKKLAKSSLF